MKLKRSGFTLAELLIVLSIMGIIISATLFALTGARASARDSQRKSDLEDIRSALEIVKADCGSYPASIPLGQPMAETCNSKTNTYMSKVPDDPQKVSGYHYVYVPVGNPATSYTLCSYLEHGTSFSGNCDGTGSNCGSGGAACAYSVTNP